MTTYITNNLLNTASRTAATVAMTTAPSATLPAWAVWTLVGVGVAFVGFVAWAVWSLNN